MNVATQPLPPLSWSNLLSEEKEKDYFKKVLDFVSNERQKGKIIYPANKDIFNAFALTTLDNLKIVIIGQDPYHGPNQAHGLCFSVKKGIPKPPSLMNIFKELEADLGITPPAHGCLEHWATQGVLLLNTVLSVEQGKAHSHAGIGWEVFTDRVIEIISNNLSGVIFLLWGSPAQKKASLIDSSKHFLLKAPHPSPLSAHRGFLGCKHFSTANKILKEVGKEPIDWKISD